MMSRLVRFILGLLKGRRTYSMAVVRRYADANGAFVGELYLLGSFCGVLQYNMIGVSLDTLPFDCQDGVPGFDLDVDNDFLAPMPEGCVRVGAQDPRDNDAVRSHVAKLAREGRIDLKIQNRFVEHAMGRPGKGD